MHITLLIIYRINLIILIIHFSHYIFRWIIIISNGVHKSSCVVIRISQENLGSFTNFSWTTLAIKTWIIKYSRVLYSLVSVCFLFKVRIRFWIISLGLLDVLRNFILALETLLFLMFLVKKFNLIRIMFNENKVNQKSQKQILMRFSNYL